MTILFGFINIKKENYYNMGMYTGLRFKGIIKKEYRNMVDDLINNDDLWGWSEIYDKYSEFNFIGEFLNLTRSNMIPFGSLVYMPEEWQELIDEVKGKKYDNFKDADGWERMFDDETGYLQFQCSLKNYDSEIEYFLNKIITIIAESTLYIEVHYEEDRYGHLYNLIEGKIVYDEENKIDYEPWNSDEFERYY